MPDLRNPGLLLGLIVLVALASPAAAFGAGNIASISKVEGQNWRHGDIEDALLTLAMAHAFKGKKFTKIMVSRVYFGNWLRDYSQAIDVGTVKSVSAEAIRLLLCILGFLTFGYGSGEFEVTADRLGCYRPEDHIDNPKNYADNQDARQYDRRLRGPIDERTELSVDPESGMKNYIANERAGIMTSAQHVRRLFSGCIELGRRYKQGGNKDDLYEALRLMGTGLHCLEDFFAHSNYTELALIEMGEGNVFPHCGRNTLIQLQGARQEVYPIVTGTFGGVDFLHSVVGEVSDKLTQNEIDELEGTLQESKNADTSVLRDLLDKIPDGLFGGKKQSNRIDEIQSEANTAQLQGMSVSPKDPEEFTVYVGQVFRQVMPAIQFHDDIMKSITSAVEKIPVLPKIIEQLEEQLSKFVFSVIAPMVVPLIHQIRNELRTGSGEIVHSSEQEQHIVFEDDGSSDPTHSMLSKDHFSNILNEVAGRTAAKMLHWVVPQIMEAIDDDDTDVNRLLDRIVHGVLHHPVQREMGRDGVVEARRLIFGSVEEWWREMGDDQREDYRRKLSREGVRRGENHKEGVNDTGHGHGCSGKLKMRKLYGEPETLETKIAGAAADAIVQGATGAFSGMVEQNTGYKMPSAHGSQQEEKREEEGGLSGFLSAAGSILGSAFGKDEKEKHSSHRREDDGSYTQTQTEFGRHEGRYAQADRYEQQESHSGRQTAGYGYEERTETRPTYGGGYEGRQQGGGYGGSSNRRNENSYGGHGDNYGGGGGHGGREESYESSGSNSRREESYGSSNSRRDNSYGSSGGNSDNGRRGGHGTSGRRRDDSDDDDDEYGRSERRPGHGQGGYGGGGY
ncbi:heterokaryon incompatibility protein het-C domain-containing protein [Hirsutella rhossiliensis]|uniref:Heterokaryon incompatibility protein het-C domain-containing protein n=1 Tax=Hirsutella rhossiliensis TaxID=111463 RepID=A0A9P8MVV0_9HYPO|nr:heterokaryon incompatibility protein het-C domain-containing protein [Hirsutella rhossiliensis]KAH0962342.1 heterokaryon incompatibility protein het-C domain-containing protein [Hirsutella rhossiliensis]